MPNHRHCRGGYPRPSLSQSAGTTEAPSPETRKSTLRAVMNCASSDPRKAKTSPLSAETVSALQFPSITAEVRGTASHSFVFGNESLRKQKAKGDEKGGSRDLFPSSAVPTSPREGLDQIPQEHLHWHLQRDRHGTPVFSQL